MFSSSNFRRFLRGTASAPPAIAAMKTSANPKTGECIRMHLPFRGPAGGLEWLLAHDLEDKSVLTRSRLRGLHGETFLCHLPPKFLAISQHGDGDDLRRVKAVPEVLVGVRATRQALDENLLARPTQNRGIENVFFDGETDVLRRVTQGVHLVERPARLKFGGTLAGDQPRGGAIDGLAVHLKPLSQLQQALFGLLRNRPV